MHILDGSLYMNGSDYSWTFESKIPSEVDEASAVVRELVLNLTKLNWSEKDRFAIHMATEEALMNAVKHGNSEDRSKSVDVVLKVGENFFYARIADEGDGFDPENVPDPCEECNLEKTSGRGVSLIRSFVDSVKYNQTGNVIEFEKRRSETESD